jgi:hypothetical protein
METQVTPTERYTLVNIETDRITTSINTLREQVAAWTGAGVKREIPAETAHA